MAPKSVTLSDLERCSCRYFAFMLLNSVGLGTNYINVVEGETNTVCDKNGVSKESSFEQKAI